MVESSLSSEISATTTLPTPSDTSLDNSGLNEVTISWVDNSNNEDGFYIYRSPDGSSFSQIADVSAETVNYTDTGVSDDTTYWYYVESYTEHSTASGSTVSINTYLNATRSANSYSSIIDSDVIQNIDVSYNISSHGATVTSDSNRIVSLFRETSSGSNSISSSLSQGGISRPRTITSESKQARSFVYNERTSLELIDHKVIWDEPNSVWYTNWFSETRILENEDQLAIRSLIIDDAKEPTARVKVQYDKNGNGLVDEESDVIHLGRGQMVKDITGIPVDEDGYYRIKIMEYSGYNSLYAIDIAIVH